VNLHRRAQARARHAGACTWGLHLSHVCACAESSARGRAVRRSPRPRHARLQLDRYACVRDAIRLAGTKPCCARAPWPATLRASTTDWCGVIKNNRTLPESAGAGTACMRAYTGGAPGARLSLRRERAQPAAVQLVVRLWASSEGPGNRKLRYRHTGSPQRLQTPPVPLPLILGVLEFCTEFGTTAYPRVHETLCLFLRSRFPYW